MNVRIAVLPVGGAIVLAMGLYLLDAVHAEPHAVTAAATPSVAAPLPPVAAVAARDGTAEAPNPSAPPPPRPAAPSTPPPPDSQEAGSGDANVWGGMHHHHRHRDGDEEAGSGEDTHADPKLDQLMGEANHAYDRGDLDDARKMAQQVLADHPDNARMLRVMVSSYCIDGDMTNAVSFYKKLTPNDQKQMQKRCDRYGVQFPAQ